jgi:hypothetical protein
MARLHGSLLPDEPVELRAQAHRVNEDGLLAAQVQDADFQRVPLRAGPMNMVRSSSISTFRMAVRAACSMSSSISVTAGTR